MLQAEIIAPVKSTREMLSTKKDGGLRFCADFRHLNYIMKRDLWLMHRVDEVLDEVEGSTVFKTV